MLTFVEVNSPEQIRKFIASYDPSVTTWIVSDLKSKLDIQSRCLDADGYFIDDSILRVSDFWKLWLRRLKPDLTVISREFMKVIIGEFIQTDEIKSLQQTLEIEEHQHTTIFRYLNELAPILLSPDTDSVVQEWIVQNNKTWYKWFLISRMCIRFLINEKKVVDASWIPSLLQGDVDLMAWDKSIVLDLGSEMNSVEFGIFKSLANRLDVCVYVPNPEWKSKFKFLLNTYNLNRGYALKTPSVVHETFSAETKIFKRYGSEILEIKAMVRQVREWLDQGVSANRIGLLSPRLEDYWPTLRLHLEAEGVPYNKNVVAPVISLGHIQMFLAQLKTQSQNASWASLEQAHFGERSERQNNHKFEKFRSLFFEMTDAEDFVRDDEVQKIYYDKTNLNRKISRNEFLVVIVKNWFDFAQSFRDSVRDDGCFAEAIKDLIAGTIDAAMNVKFWLEVFTTVLSRKEVILKKGDPSGVEMRSIQSMHAFNLQYVVWFGLDESGFRKKNGGVLPAGDVEELRFQFDFALDYPEESHTEFNVRWISMGRFNSQIFTTSRFSAGAEPLNTSLFVLESQPYPDVEFDIVRTPTYLDYAQYEFANSGAASGKLQAELTYVPNIVPSFNLTQFSATEMISYDHCHFKLLAAKGFKLRTYPVVSLDIDPRQRGTINHALFEFLVRERRYASYSSDETSAFLDQARAELRLYPYMDDFWLVQKKKLLFTAEKFCAYEDARLGQVAVEHLIESSFRWTIDKVTVEGRIDRVDVYPGSRAVVYDYKRSSGSSGYGVNWMEKKEFQLLFYLVALGSQFNLDDQGAFYFFYKNIEVYKGLLNLESQNAADFQLSLAVQNKSVVDAELYAKIKADFVAYMFEVERLLLVGEMTAKPFRVEICADCDWRNLCRAPHL